MREQTVLLPPKRTWIRLLTVIISALGVLTAFNNCGKVPSQTETSQIDTAH